MLNFKRKRVLNPNLVKRVVSSMLMLGILGTNTGQVNFASASLSFENGIIADIPPRRVVRFNPAEEHIEGSTARRLRFNRSERPASVVKTGYEERQHAAPTGGNNRNEMGSESVEERQKIDQDWEVLIFNDRENQRQATSEPHDAAEENAATTNVNTQPEPIDYGEPSDPAEAFLRYHNANDFAELPLNAQKQLVWELGCMEIPLESEQSRQAYERVSNLIGFEARPNKPSNDLCPSLFSKCNLI